MSRKRRSYESGHKAKYLVVIDDSAECDRAIYYASRRASRNNAILVSSSAGIDIVPQYFQNSVSRRAVA